MRRVTAAAVQPIPFRFEEEEKNVEHALAYIDEAALAGAEIVCFPEGYPGPYSGDLNYEPDETLEERAAERGVFVIHSRLSPATNDKYHLLARLIEPSGNCLGTYTRVQVPSSEVNHALFGKDLSCGTEDDLVVYETDLGNVGLLICSEAYSPELARILALQGADIIFYPVGGMIHEYMATFKAVLWARAIENLTYVVTTQNLFDGEKGIAMIAGPEGVVAESSDPGILLGVLDLDRLDELREGVEVVGSVTSYRVVPGLLRWRRPEVYGKLAEVPIATEKG